MTINRFIFNVPSQLNPAYPDMHWHWYLSPLGMHVPPFLHGSFWHGLASGNKYEIVQRSMACNMLSMYRYLSCYRSTLLRLRVKSNANKGAPCFGEYQKNVSWSLQLFITKAFYFCWKVTTYEIRRLPWIFCSHGCGLIGAVWLALLVPHTCLHLANLPF